MFQFDRCRMAMMPDEKYPDASLYPTNSTAMLYGTLQKGMIIIFTKTTGH